MIQSSQAPECQLRQRGALDTPLSRGMTLKVLREDANVNEKIPQRVVRDIDWTDQHWTPAVAPFRIRHTRVKPGHNKYSDQ
jgi:hypothetical protein